MYNMPAVNPARTHDEVLERVKLWISNDKKDDYLLLQYLGWTFDQYAKWIETGEIPQ